VRRAPLSLGASIGIERSFGPFCTRSDCIKERGPKMATPQLSAKTGAKKATGLVGISGTTKPARGMPALIATGAAGRSAAVCQPIALSIGSTSIVGIARPTTQDSFRDITRARCPVIALCRK